MKSNNAESGGESFIIYVGHSKSDYDTIIASHLQL